MKNLSKVFVIILIINVFFTYNISMAENKADLQKEKSNLTSSISEAQEQLEDIEEEKSATLKQVENLISEISDYQSEINDLDEQISDLTKQIGTLGDKIEQDEKEYKELQEKLNERLVALYENGETSYLDVLLSSSSLTDFISSFYIVSDLTNYDSEMLEKIETEKKQIEEEKQTLENNKKNLDNAKESKELKAKALSVAKKEKEEKASELSSEEKATQKAIEEMKEDSLMIDKMLKKIAEEEAAAARKAAEEAAKKAATGKKGSSSNSSSSTTPSVAPSSSGYVFPVAGCSKANIRNKTYPSYAGHTGVDVNINVTGKSVVAVKSGTVVTSGALRNSNGSYRSYGEYIIINHHDGTMTLYAHMLAGSRRVSEGATVSQGQVIGTVGSTGNSTGTHLHFEVRVGGKAVNPLPYLP